MASRIESISSSTRKRKCSVDLSHSSLDKPHEPFKMSEVAAFFRNLSGQKAEIVEHLKFSGLMKLPNWKPGFSLNRRFSLWLMNNVDVKGRALDLGQRGRISFKPEDVHRVFGLPCVGQVIRPSCPDGIHDTVEKIKKLLLLQNSDKLDMAAIEKIVLSDYPVKMSSSQRISFLVAVVIYSVSYFLAPKGTPPKLNYDVLHYLTDPVSAFYLNWSEYVLDVLMKSCKLVQKGSNWLEKEKITLDGCILFLQIIYLDNLDFGPSKTVMCNRPRVSDFSYSVLENLVALDSDPTSPDDIYSFGVTEMRDPSESIYTHGEYFRATYKRISVDVGIADDEHFNILEQFSSSFFWEQKKNIRKMTTEFAMNLCKQVDSSQATFMAMAKEWFISRKRRIERDERLRGQYAKKEVNSSAGRETDADSSDYGGELAAIWNMYSVGNDVVEESSSEGTTEHTEDQTDAISDPVDGTRTPIVKFLPNDESKHVAISGALVHCPELGDHGKEKGSCSSD